MHPPWLLTLLYSDEHSPNIVPAIINDNSVSRTCIHPISFPSEIFSPTRKRIEGLALHHIALTKIENIRVLRGFNVGRDIQAGRALTKAEWSDTAIHGSTVMAIYGAADRQWATFAWWAEGVCTSHSTSQAGLLNIIHLRTWSAGVGAEGKNMRLASQNPRCCPESEH